MSGDAVRDEPAFQPGNLIAQHQFPLFQPLQVKLIGGPLICQPGNHRVEITMLAPEAVQLSQQRIAVAQHIYNPALKFNLEFNFIYEVRLAHPAALALQFSAVSAAAADGDQPVLNGGSKSMSSNPRFEALKGRHESLEGRIFEEDNRPRPDSETLMRLKIEKLHIKEEMERLRTQLD
jgi:hypothetical protein